jgi:flavin-dependent dehydrogenase
MPQKYDAIIVGARCAGSPTAMLLARKGYRVLMVDRATFPSDTMSSHFVHSPGIAALDRWGVLDDLIATGCPPVTRYIADFGPLTIEGSPLPADGVSRAYAPRRRILDQVLVDAAVRAGAELRERFVVEELLIENGVVRGIKGHDEGGRSITESSRIVVGADGVRSVVAEAAGASRYRDKGSLSAGYYTYWSGVPTQGLEIFVRERRSWGAFPTHHGLTCIAMAWPRSEFEANRHHVEESYLKSLELAPEFAERVRAGKREERFVGTGNMPNFFRKPYGPGWALVGDAGYHKDFCTAQGISDAFRDSERLAEAIDASFTGRLPIETAMARYEEDRNEHAAPMFEFTCQLAALEPPPPEMQQLLGAIHGNQAQMDNFVSVIAGTLPVPQFFSPDNIGRIMAEAREPSLN